MTEQDKRYLPETYIINVSSKLSLFARARDIVLTILLWCFFFYLIRDFYAFLAALFNWLHDGTGPARSYPKLHILRTLGGYSLSLAIFAALFIIWPMYNRLRFRKKTRRRAALAVTAEELAEMYKLDLQQLKQWQQTGSLKVHLDGDGRVTKVDTIAP